MTLARSLRTAESLIDLLRILAWISISLGFVIFASPLHLAELLNHPLPPWLFNLMAAGLLVCILVGSLFWAAARGLSRGGSMRDLKRGVCVNIMVIAACILAAAVLR